MDIRRELFVEGLQRLGDRNVLGGLLCLLSICHNSSWAYRGLFGVQRLLLVSESRRSAGLQTLTPVLGEFGLDLLTDHGLLSALLLVSLLLWFRRLLLRRSRMLFRSWPVLALLVRCHNTHLLHGVLLGSFRRLVSEVTRLLLKNPALLADLLHEIELGTARVVVLSLRCDAGSGRWRVILL